jgi:hypothetical protein
MRSIYAIYDEMVLREFEFKFHIHVKQEFH